MVRAPSHHTTRSPVHAWVFARSPTPNPSSDAERPTRSGRLPQSALGLPSLTERRRDVVRKRAERALTKARGDRRGLKRGSAQGFGAFKRCSTKRSLCRSRVGARRRPTHTTLLLCPPPPLRLSGCSFCPTLPSAQKVISGPADRAASTIASQVTVPGFHLPRPSPGLRGKKGRSEILPQVYIAGSGNPKICTDLVDDARPRDEDRTSIFDARLGGLKEMGRDGFAGLRSFSVPRDGGRPTTPLTANRDATPSPRVTPPGSHGRAWRGRTGFVILGTADKRL